jgi:thiol-disulfide isomerase/thioredoxin
MRKVLASLVLLGGIVGCSAESGLPGRPDVTVDSAELREVKERIGMADCAPGPGEGPVEGGLPDLTLACLGGGQDVNLASLRGPMVLNFWQSYCQPCREEMPALESFQQEHGDRVPVLGLDVNDIYPGKALELAEETGATYASLADPGGEVFSTKALAFARRGLPAFVFLAEDGTVAGRSSGGVESVAEVEALVEEHLGVRL